MILIRSVLKWTIAVAAWTNPGRVDRLKKHNGPHRYVASLVDRMGGMLAVQCRRLIRDASNSSGSADRLHLKPIDANHANPNLAHAPADYMRAHRQKFVYFRARDWQWLRPSKVTLMRMAVAVKGARRSCAWRKGLTRSPSQSRKIPAVFEAQR